jgi:UDP-N-acetylmuramate--alanine ligase
MYQIDFTKPIHVHFIGIGGISMSGLAELLHIKGFTITGSDAKQSKTTDHLNCLGIVVNIGQCADNINNDIDLVVYTAAIHPENEEYQAVVTTNIPMLDRAAMLGQVMKQYKSAISIAGTHGKTTTTSMVSLMMLEGNMDPTISVGGILDNIEGNIRIGKSEHFIVESCEYMNSFLSFHPTHGIILNIEAEHLDFFKDLDDVRNSFRLFAKNIPEHGNLVINGSIENYKEITNCLACNVITYGILPPSFQLGTTSSPYDYAAANISYNEVGFGSFDLIHGNQFVTRIRLSVVGEHNISNAVSAIALVAQLGVSYKTIQSGLLKFKGTKRRFEYKGEIGGVTIVDDYAHHPTEVKATLTAAISYPHKTLWCVFQPHTYTRTKALFQDFIDALSLADKIVLADIYAAREEDPGDISSKDIQEKLLELGKNAYYFRSFKEIEKFLLENCTNGDLLITMGAGDVVSIGESLLSK